MAVAGGAHERDSRLAHSRFQLHIIAAGAAVVVAAEGAQAELHQRDTLLAESQTKLLDMTRERDGLTEKLTAELASFRHQHDQAEAEYKSLGASHGEAIDMIKKTRQALSNQEEQSRALQAEIEDMRREDDRRVQQELDIEDQQMELRRQEEKLASDTNKFNIESRKCVGRSQLQIRVMLYCEELAGCGEGSEALWHVG